VFEDLDHHAHGDADDEEHRQVGELLARSMVSEP